MVERAGQEDRRVEPMRAPEQQEETREPVAASEPEAPGAQAGQARAALQVPVALQAKAVLRAMAAQAPAAARARAALQVKAAPQVKAAALELAAARARAPMPRRTRRKTSRAWMPAKTQPSATRMPAVEAVPPTVWVEAAAVEAVPPTSTRGNDRNRVAEDRMVRRARFLLGE
jgi:hypothetical protein